MLEPGAVSSPAPRSQATRGLAVCIPLLVAWGCADAGSRAGHAIQEVSRVEDVVPCDPTSDACDIFWVPMGSIGGPGSPPGMDPTGGPAVDSRGRVYCAGWSPGVLVVWDLSGRVIGTLGSPGEGPGEMVGLTSPFIGTGDTLHIRDNASAWSVFTPNLEFVRKVSHAALPPPNFLGLTSDGHMVAAYGSPVFRVMRPDGRDSVRFGVPDAVERDPRRVVAAGRHPDRFWATPAHRLALTEWSIDGTERRRLEVRGSAMPDQPSDQGWDPQAGTPPPAILNYLVEDAQGLLWVRAILPDPGYTPSLRDPQDASYARLKRMYRVLVEVVDPATGTVVASAVADTVEDGVSGLLPGPWGFRIIEDRSGIMRYDFGKLVLGARRER